MPKIVYYTICSLMIAVGLVAMYSLLNAGSPESLVRFFLPNPASDIYVACISSFVVFVLGFIVFFTKDRQGFRNLIELNSQRIRAMRIQGKSDGEIADSLLAAMGSTQGYKHQLARKKLIIYLSEFQ